MQLFLVLSATTMVLSGVAAIVSLHFWLPIRAARTVSVWWGLGSFFIPPATLLFAILHWQQARKPVLSCLTLLGIAVLMFVLRFAAHVYVQST